MLIHIFVFSILISLAYTASAQEVDSDSAVESVAPQNTSNPPEEAVVAPQVAPPSAEIVVTAHKDWCNPHVLSESIYTDGTIWLDKLIFPGHKDSDQVESKNPNFFDGERQITFVSSVDNEKRKFKLYAGYYSCKKNEVCDQQPRKYESFGMKLVEDTTRLILQRDLDLYRLEMDVGFDEIYDARGEEVNVACPRATCMGFTGSYKDGDVFYTVTNRNGSEERRLIVNAAFKSKFVDGEGDVIEKCLEYVPRPIKPTR